MLNNLTASNNSRDFIPAELTIEEGQLVITVVQAILHDIEDRIERLWPEEPVIVTEQMDEYNFRRSRHSLGMFVHFAQGNGAYCLLELPDLLQEVHSMCAGVEQLTGVIDVVVRVNEAAAAVSLNDRMVKMQDLGLKPAIFADLLK